MRKTRQTIAVQKSVMDELHGELGEQNATLVIMAKYFNEANEKSEVCFNRLEKQTDNMHATISRHMEDIRVIHTESVNLRERTSNKVL